MKLLCFIGMVVCIMMDEFFREEKTFFLAFLTASFPTHKMLLKYSKLLLVIYHHPVPPLSCCRKHQFRTEEVLEAVMIAVKTL